MRAALFAGAGAITLLSGCAASPAWLTVGSAALGYVASVNNLGAEWLRFKERPVCPVPAQPITNLEKSNGPN
jgi:hypothetical protein